MSGPHENLPQVQELIRLYVDKHILAIKNKEPGVADAVVEYANQVTLEGLIQCGVSPEIAESKKGVVAGGMLQFELFNAWLGDL